jgi:dsRNA-specific ribonuclease
VPPGRGVGRSKREAEHAAASMVLRREGVWSAS